MKKTKAVKTLELVFISEIKIIGIRKTTKPNAICVIEQPFSMEKMSITQKNRAVRMPIINFIFCFLISYTTHKNLQAKRIYTKG